jgi:hypothetical protein
VFLSHGCKQRVHHGYVCQLRVCEAALYVSYCRDFHALRRIRIDRQEASRQRTNRVRSPEDIASSRQETEQYVVLPGVDCHASPAPLVVQVMQGTRPGMDPGREVQPREERHPRTGHSPGNRDGNLREIQIVDRMKFTGKRRPTMIKTCAGGCGKNSGPLSRTRPRSTTPTENASVEKCDALNSSRVTSCVVTIPGWSNGQPGKGEFSLMARKAQNNVQEIDDEILRCYIHPSTSREETTPDERREVADRWCAGDYEHHIGMANKHRLLPIALPIAALIDIDHPLLVSGRGVAFYSIQCGAEIIQTMAKNQPVAEPIETQIPVNSFHKDPVERV